MKARIVVPCVLTVIGATVLLGQRGDSSNLSRREMSQIRGSCACYEVQEVDCRVYGELKCDVEGDCSADDSRESDYF